MLKALKALAKNNWHLSTLFSFVGLNVFVKIKLQNWLDKSFGNDIEMLPNVIR